MNISVTNLDNGYTQCQTLHTLVTGNGAGLITSLEDNIASLKTHWKGTDATKHINNLITVHDVLVELIADATKLTSAAAGAMIAIQEVRKANGGSTTVGEQLSNSAPASQTIAKVEETSEYLCDPSASTDQGTLATILEKFGTFATDFEEAKNELMANWLQGANRGEADACFTNFVTNAGVYKEKLSNANEKLTTALSNIAKLQ